MNFLYMLCNFKSVKILDFHVSFLVANEGKYEITLCQKRASDCVLEYWLLITNFSKWLKFC